MDNKCLPSLLAAYNDQEVALAEKNALLVKLQQRHERRLTWSSRMAANINKKESNIELSKMHNLKTIEEIADLCKKKGDTGDNLKAAHSDTEKNQAGISEVKASSIKAAMDTNNDLMQMQEDLKGDKLTNQIKDYENKKEQRRTLAIQYLKELKKISSAPVKLMCDDILEYRGLGYCTKLEEKEEQIRINTIIAKEKLEQINAQILKFTTMEMN